MIANLGKEFKLTMEKEISRFLGIQIDELEDGSLFLTQTALIDRILRTCFMQDCNAKDTPASSTALGTDLLGDTFVDDFSYPSAVGMLLYLASNSRPDLFRCASVRTFHTLS